VVAVQYSGWNVKRNVFAFGADFENSRNIGKYLSHGPSGDAPHFSNFARREMPLLGNVSPRFIGRHARPGDCCPCRRRIFSCSAASRAASRTLCVTTLCFLMLQPLHIRLTLAVTASSNFIPFGRIMYRTLAIVLARPPNGAGHCYPLPPAFRLLSFLLTVAINFRSAWNVVPCRRLRASASANVRMPVTVGSSGSPFSKSTGRRVSRFSPTVEGDSLLRGKMAPPLLAPSDR
jgi:hypothetical protein